MRALFSILGLLVVVAVIGVLAKKQLASVPTPPAVAVPSGAAAAPEGTAAAPATPQQQVQQFKQAVEAAQQPRELPAEAK
jgi:hypothetical protein